MEPNLQTPQGTEHHHHLHPEHRHLVEVHFHVNDRPVHLKGHRHTGLQIKEAAIAQHVKIQVDFLLYLVRHHHPNQPIADDEEVHITDESRFHAIADDDNS
jgi:thioredoxin reductase